MSAGPQVMLVVEYPCDRFCRIEVDVTGERGQATLQQLRDQAEILHQRAHEPVGGETGTPVTEAEPAGRPAATVFLSAPGGGGSAPEHGHSTPRRGGSTSGRGGSGRGGDRRR